MNDDYELEYHEEGNAFKGMLILLPFALAMWAIIILAIMWIMP